VNRVKQRVAKRGTTAARSAKLSVALPPGPILRLDYARNAALVARELLGHRLGVFRDGAWTCGTIVETEAYLGPQDLAAHSSKGLTPRTAIMFGSAGRAYVYLVYGLHHCFNVVTGGGAAVLVRALELPGVSARSGPGKLTKLLGISREHTGRALDGPPIALFEGSPVPAAAISSGPRIGVDYAGPYWAGRKLRYWVTDHHSLSRK
jgi:DNA-3-methyladenine glycosylase